MPHLTPALGLAGFGVPAYAHPLVAPAEWAELTRPGTPVHWVVLDASCGLGRRPDPLYEQAVVRLHEAGVRVLGHLDAAYGTRPLGELLDDAHHFIDCYQVTGFYLDRAPTDRARLQRCRRATATLGALLDGGHLVLGHGTHPDPGYAEAADQLVTYLGPWTDYRWSQVPQWTADHPPERFCHLVHGVPRPHLETAMRIARWQGAATVFFTDRDEAAGTDPWEGLPGYWEEATRMLRDRPWEGRGEPVED